MNRVADFCRGVYDEVYNGTSACLSEETLRGKQKDALSEKEKADIEVAAQKEAIKEAFVRTVRNFPQKNSADIWRCVYETHIHRKSGIADSEIIAKIISADQSWKKSSGHAFEETIKALASDALANDGIRIVLQRDLSILIKAGEIANEPRDISWLKEQIEGNIFDLFALVEKDGKCYCFGCIQSKTSIRDRVTRDREPSIHAMQSFFWSVVIVLDGDFLRLPKFVSMVNGGTQEFPTNGWHAMYALSIDSPNGRIYPSDLDFTLFRSHAVNAAKYWLTQRQWFNCDWMA